jgi:hypothetical protein
MRAGALGLLNRHAQAFRILAFQARGAESAKYGVPTLGPRSVTIPNMPENRGITSSYPRYAL